MLVRINQKTIGKCVNIEFDKNLMTIIYRKLQLSNDGCKYFPKANTIDMFDLQYSITEGLGVLINITDTHYF